MSTADELLIKVALEYAALGLPVFPCVYAPDDEERNKKPHTRHGFKDATTDPQEITRWWTRWPEAHVAIATGEPSGIVILDLDVDEKKGKNGLAQIPDWESRSNVIVRSPRTGIHLWFKYEPEKPIRNSSDKIALGVDTRGDGGYAIVPHPRNGSAYVFEKGCANDLKDLKPFPDDLRARLSVDTERTPNANPEAPIELVALAASLIPNDDLGWDDWNSIGMAIFRATAGSEEGFKVFDSYSQKSGKYDARKTRKRWLGYLISPPTKIGYGTLAYKASQAVGPRWDVKVYEELIERLNTPDNGETLAWLHENVWHTKPDDIPKIEAQPIAEPAPATVVTPSWAVTPTPPKKTNYLLSSAAFVAGYVPPEYLIDGWLQRRYVYSITAPTGSGKTAIALRIAAHVALGLPVAGRAVEEGQVLYFAGENPDDVRTRWIKLCDELGKEPSEMKVVFLAGTPNITNEIIHRQIENEAFDHGEFSLLIVDTAAAYFSGDDENSNKQLGDFARDLRKYVDLKGGPTVLVTCHPKKDFDITYLVPRGGGAFLNEMDGNIVVLKDGDVLTIDTHGKFRGPEFDPFSFKLLRGYNEKIKDAKGRLISSVTCEPITDEARTEMENEGRDKQDQLMLAMKANPKASLNELAVVLNLANKGVVFREMQKLEKEKWVAKKGSHYELTKRGLEVVEEIEFGTSRIKAKEPTITKNLLIHDDREKAVLASVPGETVEYWFAKSNISIKSEPNEDKTYEVTMKAWVWLKREPANKSEPEPDDRPM